ncbi:polysaccharide lyase family 8 super-sandwich domain-containing protein [Dysgonomonas termitidis]|uniref:Polysaccharide lyase family 8 super-sandwich domain-containing protein n=1 Tax=Dysgonomonas termitidis TaxID=1516126 RepID=A0ABV9KZU4_9BACT
MQNKIISLGLFLLFTVFVAAQQQDIDLITGRLVDQHLQGSYSPQQVNQYMSSIKADGSWSDVDYDAVVREFPSGPHLERLVQMALAYRKTGSEFSNSKFLLDKILLGIDYYFKKHPRSTNWWWNEIGGPQNYMAVLILLKGKIEKEKLHHYSSYLEDRTSNAAHKGKNRTWISSITMHKGCIEDNYQLISISFNSIASTIIIADSKMVEGMKIDNSIHQHRPQLYSGGYGMSFMSDLAQFIHLSRQTSFAQLFTPEKMEIFRQTMLGGQQIFGYRRTYDFGTEGRNISRVGHMTNISPGVLELMAVIDSANAPAYDAWRRHLDGAPFPQVGNKFFWNSAIMTYHGGNYYLSAKVISTRTNGTEMLNGENLKGYNLPLGTTNILTSGKEYFDIFPVWNWARIPGTTVLANQDSTRLEGYHFGTNKFAGGVSNGKNGVLAYEHHYRGVQAKKAYFFAGDAMLCLGAGISSVAPDKVETTLNQCFANGDVFYSENGKVQKLDNTGKTSSHIDWVHHDNVGYIFPQASNCVIQSTDQKGSWQMIRDLGDEEELTEKVFSLWVDHGNKPQNSSYAYIVMPDVSISNFEQKAKQHGFEVLENTSRLQVVRNKEAGSCMIVFYSPGTATLAKGFRITADKPAMVLLEGKDEEYQISVSDPLYEAREITLNVSKKLNGPGATVLEKQTAIKIELPQGEYAGSIVDRKFNLIK